MTVTVAVDSDPEHFDLDIGPSSNIVHSSPQSIPDEGIILAQNVDSM